MDDEFEILLVWCSAQCVFPRSGRARAGAAHTGGLHVRQGEIQRGCGAASSSIFRVLVRRQKL